MTQASLAVEIICGTERYTANTDTVLAEFPGYRVRRCVNAAGREAYLQVATSAEHNRVIGRQITALGALQRAAERVNAATERRLGYDYAFPELLGSTVLSSQAGRSVAILGLRGVARLDDVMPLSRLLPGPYVDLKTSAWIVGRLFKWLAFAHEQLGWAVGRVRADNILLAPSQHYVVFFDWAHTLPVEVRNARLEVRTAAQLGLRILGGDLDAARDNELERAYTDCLSRLAVSDEHSAREAHREFYECVDSLIANPASGWRAGFYPFTLRGAAPVATPVTTPATAPATAPDPAGGPRRWRTLF